MADRWPLRVTTTMVGFDHGKAEHVVHPASITVNGEFAHTPCGRMLGAGSIQETERAAVVTCIRCWATLMRSGDTWR